MSETNGKLSAFNGQRALTVINEICSVSEAMGSGQDPYSLKGKSLTRYVMCSRKRALTVWAMFEPFGWKVETLPFAHKSVDGLNLLIHRGDGIKPGAVLIVAHHDYCAGVGAEDDGTALAVMIEMARVLPQDANVVFASCDFEECGAIGSDALAQELQERHGLTFSCVIALECLGSGKDIVISSRMDGVDSDAEVVERLRSASARRGTEFPVTDFDCFYSDHVPFARRGCKTAQLCSLDLANKVPPEGMDAQRKCVARGGRRKDGSVAHTRFDNPAEIKAGNLQAVGDVLYDFITAG